MLANRVDERRNRIPTHDRQIQQMARDIYAQTQTQQLADASKPIATRTDGPIRDFHASNGWVYDFKHRNKIINTHHPVIRPNPPKDKSHSINVCYSFLLSTLPHFPHDMVINMDETPLPFAPSKWNVISKRGDPTTPCTGTILQPHTLDTAQA